MRAIVASAAVLVPAARAQTTANRGPVNDSLFAADAAAGGLAQLSFSGIGLPKATDPGPRTFSQQMIDVHARLNQELTTLAAQKQIALPRPLDARARFCGEGLGGVPREDFDRCYAKARLAAHREAVAAFEAKAERGQGSRIKALAAEALPVLKMYLKMISRSP